MIKKKIKNFFTALGKEMVNDGRIIGSIFKSIFGNRIVLGLILNIFYFGVILGGFFAWCIDGEVVDLIWWIKLIIFVIIINLHRDIHNWIIKNGW